MRDESEFVFGHDTVVFRAVFVPDGAEVSLAEIIEAVGPTLVMFQAIWVSNGGALPGYPYEHIGRAMFIPDNDDHAMSAFTRGQRTEALRPVSLATPLHGDALHALEDRALHGRRWSGASPTNAAGPWRPGRDPAGGHRSSGVSAPRRSVRSTLANFSAAAPRPYLDTSGDAIDAAVRALSLNRSDGAVPRL